MAFASEIHGTQVRKGTNVPYISHLLAVTALVIEEGGNEDTAIAALLHDAVEDQGGEDMLLRIRERYGNTVADIVDACSDSVTDPKPPWRERKEAHLKAIPHKSQETLLVLLADKAHNAMAVLKDFREAGEVVWERFNGKKEGTLWYYRALTDAFGSRLATGLSTRLWRQLEHAVNALEVESSMT